MDSARFLPIFVKNVLKDSVILVGFVIVSLPDFILLIFCLWLFFFSILPKRGVDTGVGETTHLRRAEGTLVKTDEGVAQGPLVMEGP